MVLGGIGKLVNIHAAEWKSDGGLSLGGPYAQHPAATRERKGAGKG